MQHLGDPEVTQAAKEGHLNGLPLFGGESVQGVADGGRFVRLQRRLVAGGFNWRINGCLLQILQQAGTPLARAAGQSSDGA